MERRNLSEQVFNQHSLCAGYVEYVNDESLKSSVWPEVRPADDKVTSETPYVCNACGKTYRWTKSLRVHQRYECGKEPQFCCPYCPHRTKLKGNLKTHVRNVHPPTQE